MSCFVVTPSEDALSQALERGEDLRLWLHDREPLLGAWVERGACLYEDELMSPDDPGPIPIAMTTGVAGFWRLVWTERQVSPSELRAALEARARAKGLGDAEARWVDLDDGEAGFRHLRLVGSG